MAKDPTSCAPRLELWFANQDALVDLLGIEAAVQHRYLPSDQDSLRDSARKQHSLAAHLERRLLDDPPGELQREVLSSTLSTGQLVAIEQAFYFRNQKSQGRIEFSATLNTDESWSIAGIVDASRLPFSSAQEHLSRRRRVFMVATVVDIEEHRLRLRPLFIGQRTWAAARAQASSAGSRRVYPAQIGAFAEVNWRVAPTASEMKLMNNLLEADVKHALAKIIGIPFVSKDWGGERSDLSTNNLMVDGQQVSAAWLLKGRSVQGPMKVPHLGANGDQIERLSTEPAELLVVQHNDMITAAVINTVQAFAFDMRNPRRFMIMDGQATAMILRDHGYLNPST